MSQREEVQYGYKENGVSYVLKYNRFDDARSYSLRTVDTNTGETFQTGYVWSTHSQEWGKSTGDPGFGDISMVSSAEVQESVAAFSRIVDAVGRVPLPLGEPDLL